MSVNPGSDGELGQSDDYQRLLGQISDTYTERRIQATQVVNAQLIQTYWAIGQHIVEFEQGGKAKSEYGQKLLSRLSQDLTAFFSLVSHKEALNISLLGLRAYGLSKRQPL
jgi:hypothetical protein